MLNCNLPLQNPPITNDSALTRVLYIYRPWRICEIEAVEQHILISGYTTAEMLYYLLVTQGKACWPRFKLQILNLFE
jgi:hypothetical protein